MKEVVALSVGPKASQEILRTALAMGADTGIHIVTDSPVEPLGVAKLFRAVLAQVILIPIFFQKLTTIFWCVGSLRYCHSWQASN